MSKALILDGRSVRQNNRQIIKNDGDSQNAILEMRKIEQFLCDFGYLNYGRDIVFCADHAFSLELISTAAELTAGSIISCCEAGCLADAYSLLRKYRDDLFFCLYIVICNNCKTSEGQMKNINEMEANIARWISNDLQNLNSAFVLKAIGESPRGKEAVIKYGLKDYFERIGKKLNNYVHSNGIDFYNRNLNCYGEKELSKRIQSFTMDMRLITTVFFFLLSICSPISIMSTDYIDYLECNMTPPDGAQYWVAPFIRDFFKEKLAFIDKGCIEYLRESTNMEI